MTTTPEWQAKYTLLTSSPAPRRNALPASELAAQPDLALINKAAAEAVNLFPESVPVRENYNEFAKVFSRGRDEAHQQRPPDGGHPEGPAGGDDEARSAQVSRRTVPHPRRGASARTDRRGAC